jgi:hypothetical protein
VARVIIEERQPSPDFSRKTPLPAPGMTHPVLDTGHG